MKSVLALLVFCGSIARAEFPISQETNDLIKRINSDFHSDEIVNGSLVSQVKAQADACIATIKNLEAQTGVPHTDELKVLAAETEYIGSLSDDRQLERLNQVKALNSQLADAFRSQTTLKSNAAVADKVELLTQESNLRLKVGECLSSSDAAMKRIQSQKDLREAAIKEKQRALDALAAERGLQTQQRAQARDRLGTAITNASNVRTELAKKENAKAADLAGKYKEKECQFDPGTGAANCDRLLKKMEADRVSLQKEYDDLAKTKAAKITDAQIRAAAVVCDTQAMEEGHEILTQCHDKAIKDIKSKDPMTYDQATIDERKNEDRRQLDHNAILYNDIKRASNAVSDENAHLSGARYGYEDRTATEEAVLMERIHDLEIEQLRSEVAVHAAELREKPTQEAYDSARQEVANFRGMTQEYSDIEFTKAKLAHDRCRGLDDKLFSAEKISSSDKTSLAAAVSEVSKELAAVTATAPSVSENSRGGAAALKARDDGG